MMYQAFGHIAGHARQTEWLSAWIRDGRIGGTYLFCGPEHVGKETVATALASALLCEDTQARGCGDCKSCREVKSQLHPDLAVLSGEGKSQTIKKEGIEALRNRSQLASFHGGWKIGIIKDAHHLHHESAPALLKILEEPPAQSVFILLSHKEDQLLPTLRSRCKTLPFFPLSQEAMEAFVRRQFPGQDAQMPLLLGLAGGCPGLVEHVLRGELLAKRDNILAALEAFTPGRFGAALQGTDALTALAKEAADKNSRGEERLVFFLLETLLRDIWLSRLGHSDLLLHADRVERLAALEKKWAGASLPPALMQLEAAARDMELNISPRLMLENILLGVA